MDVVSLLACIEANGSIPGTEIEVAFLTDDLLELGLIREIVNSHWNRIVPHPNIIQCSRSIVRFLLMCLEQNPEPSDYLPSRYEAAHELSRLARHWADGTREFQRLLDETIESIRQLYLRVDEKTRLCIETGFLEHFLENRSSRSRMTCWENDPVTAKALVDSLRWGMAHGGGHAKAPTPDSEYD